MVQCFAVIHWYDWVLNNVLNKVYRCLRCGYAWCRIVAAALCVHVPTRLALSSVPVPDADALDMDIHVRAWT